MDSMRRMESMMDNMMAPFGGMFGRQRAHQSQNHPGMGNALMPFGFGGSLFPNMDDMFSPFVSFFFFLLLFFKMLKQDVY